MTMPVAGSLNEAALAMREVFQSYVTAGFSEYQACIIIGTMLAQSVRGNEDRTE